MTICTKNVLMKMINADHTSKITENKYEPCERLKEYNKTSKRQGLRLCLGKREVLLFAQPKQN